MLVPCGWVHAFQNYIKMIVLYIFIKTKVTLTFKIWQTNKYYHTCCVQISNECENQSCSS